MKVWKITLYIRTKIEVVPVNITYPYSLGTDNILGDDNLWKTSFWWFYFELLLLCFHKKAKISRIWCSRRRKLRFVNHATKLGCVIYKSQFASMRASKTKQQTSKRQKENHFLRNFTLLFIRNPRNNKTKFFQNGIEACTKIICKDFKVQRNKFR